MLFQKRERGNLSSGALLSSLCRVSCPASTSKGKGVVFLPETDPGCSPLPAQMWRLELGISTVLARPGCNSCNADIVSGIAITGLPVP